MVEYVLHAFRLQLDMLPEQAKWDGFMANWTFARLSAFSCMPRRVQCCPTARNTHNTHVFS